MMRFWILEAIYEPWLVNYWHERTDRMVVLAGTEKQARDIADLATAKDWDEMVPGMKHPWLNDKQTYCEEVNDRGVPRVVMKCS